MKKTLTLLVIASIILISVGCQKEDLPVTPVSTSTACPNYESSMGRNIQSSGITADKKIQNAVACKACHANKDVIQ